jgi:hypothetical protein
MLRQVRVPATATHTDCASMQHIARLRLSRKPRQSEAVRGAVHLSTESNYHYNPQVAAASHPATPNVSCAGYTSV